ncbi:MAG TPA: ABC transporter permease [Gemmatimonadales bacterium]|nr:ABC transporter permease [Gemmatimonadales bacterium]
MTDPAVIHDGERGEAAAGFPGGRAAEILRARWRSDRFFRLGVILVGAILGAAVLAPWVAPHDPLTGDLQGAYLLGPGGAHPLGTDTQGRDVLSRVLFGARLSLLVGLISQSVAVTLGVTLGLVAGYYQRWVDATVMRLADVTLAFPTLLLLIAIAAAVRPSLPLVFVVIGIVGWAAMARIVRAQVLALKGAEFVLAAQALGARDRRVLWRHLLPNVRAQVIIAATLGIGSAIMAEAALSFVGLGAQPPTPSWGAMVADGRDLLRVAPWVSFAPGIAIGIAVLGFNLVGDALREAFDPKVSSEK